MSTCKSCGADITWARAESTGNTIPVDTAPTADGNVMLYRDAGFLKARVGPPTLEGDPVGTSRHVSHFATCPNAKAHRK